MTTASLPTYGTTALEVPAPKTGRLTRLKIYGTFALLMIGIIALSFFVLSRQSLRLDESQSVWQSSHSTLGVLDVISHDVHVPLYGEMLHFWQIFFGTGVLAGRMLSLIFFLISVPAIYMLGKAAYNERIGLFASVLLAVSPFLNWYANETRMYSLLLLVTILNQYFYVRIFRAADLDLTAETQLYLWWGYGLTALLGIYTHYFFWLLLLTEAVFFFANRKKFPERSLGKFVLIAGILVAAISPWLWYVKAQGGLSNQSPLLLKPTSVDVFNVFSQFMFGFQDDHINTVIISLWPLAVLLAFLALHKHKQDSKLILFFITCALLPVGVALAVSIWVKPVFLARYLILTVPALYIFLSWLLNNNHPAISRWLKIALCAIMLLTLYQQVASAATPTKENYQAASQYLTARASPEDIIVLSAPFTIYPLEYYYNGPSSIATLPLWDPYQIGSIPHFSASALPEQVSGLAQGHEHIWLLLSYDQGYQNQISNYFQTHYQQLDHQNFSPGLDLYEYQVKY